MSLYGTNKRLSLVSFCVINGKLAQCRAGLTKSNRLVGGALNIPVIDGNPFNQPHRGRPVSARAVNERRFGAGGSDGCEELIGSLRGGGGVDERVGGLK